jgi:hypothetical protein
MVKHAKLTTEQLELIVGHVQLLLAGQQSVLDRLNLIVQTGGPPLLEGQKIYLRNSISTLRWVIETAKQRAGKQDE